jgi:hypothetical protein
VDESAFGEFSSQPAVGIFPLREASHVTGGFAMEWVTPHYEDVVLCCEINSYASANM